MGYEVIDQIIEEWAQSHGLHLLKEYKDTVVRSVDVVGKSGSRCQIWVDRPNVNGFIGVHVWDYNRKGERRDLRVAATDLPECLERVLHIAKDWVSN